LAKTSRGPGPGRRKIVQFLSALIYNAALPNFKTGALSQGPLKNLCVPGLNCYSCPAAVASCPLGALQNALAGARFPLYIPGLLLLFGVALGRWICGFLCPFGLIQELLYKLPSPKLGKSPLTRRFTLLKYAFLVILVLGTPVITLVYGYGIPLFCKFICPAGTLEAGIPLALANSAIRGSIGGLFYWKIVLLAALILASAPVYRVFCRFLCPLGALYGLLNRYALWGIRRDPLRCSNCGICAKNCKMDTRIANDRECIRCGVCIRACPARALSQVFPGQKSPVGGLSHKGGKEFL
jgi:polyferredoxin